MCPQAQHGEGLVNKAKGAAAAIADKVKAAADKVASDATSTLGGTGSRYECRSHLTEDTKRV